MDWGRTEQALRGNNVPLSLATARPTGSSPTRPPSLSRQMKRCTVDSPAPAYRGSRHPCHTEESSRSTSLSLDASVEVGRDRATRWRICRRKGDSEPIEVCAEQDQVEHVEFLSTQSRSQRKTKRPQI
jgi:hypothetical protein